MSSCIFSSESLFISSITSTLPSTIPSISKFASAIKSNNFLNSPLLKSELPSIPLSNHFSGSESDAGITIDSLSLSAFINNFAAVPCTMMFFVSFFTASLLTISDIFKLSAPLISEIRSIISDEDCKMSLSKSFSIIFTFSPAELLCFALSEI